MELTPKQQALEQIKKAEKILILGHKKPDGDMIGSGLALCLSLTEMGKKVTFVSSDKAPETLSFLPEKDQIKEKFEYTNGKLIRIDTAKVPIKGLKYQKKDNFLDIYLDAEKNLKFEHIEIKNGSEKPDLIIVIDTADVEKIDKIYDLYPELFFEVPILSIDHHPGNEYFGTINLVDLTATSTAEILVSLLEALQYRIAKPEVATLLLTGIIADTQSFRSVTTTPKSLTVAAQLLAAGAAQQEIISNLYKRKPMALLKAWGEMLSNIQEDKDHSFAWTKIDLTKNPNPLIGADDVLGSDDELLTNTPGASFLLMLVKEDEDTVSGKLRAAKGNDVLEISKALGASGNNVSAKFKMNEKSLEEAEMKVLKKIHEHWQKTGQDVPKSVWEVVQKAEESAPQAEEPKAPQEEKRPEKKEQGVDPIEGALKSLIENQVESKGFTTLGEIIKDKRKSLGQSPEEEIDVFDEENT